LSRCNSRSGEVRSANNVVDGPAATGEDDALQHAVAPAVTTVPSWV
jgi:hypothetical protein